VVGDEPSQCKVRNETSLVISLLVLCCTASRVWGRWVDRRFCNRVPTDIGMLAVQPIKFCCRRHSHPREIAV
jgi:hypothetical protein